MTTSANIVRRFWKLPVKCTTLDKMRDEPDSGRWGAALEVSFSRVYRGFGRTQSSACLAAMKSYKKGKKHG